MIDNIKNHFKRSMRKITKICTYFEKFLTNLTIKIA